MNKTSRFKFDVYYPYYDKVWNRMISAKDKDINVITADEIKRNVYQLIYRIITTSLRRNVISNIYGTD